MVSAWDFHKILTVLNGNLSEQCRGIKQEETVCVIKEEPDIEIIDIKEEIEEIPDTCIKPEIVIVDEELPPVSLTCPICSKMLSTEQSFRIHLWSHRMQYWCDICKKALCSEYVYNRHMRLHETWKVTCDVCGITLPSRSLLVAHLRSHMSPQEIEDSKARFICRICDERFSRVVRLEMHVQEKHPGEKTHSCGICKKTFTKITALKMHMRIIHKGEVPYTCEFCSRPFKYRQNMLNHVKTAHQQNNKTS
ncbi:hypothetical protein L9F63_018495 [Diploptera punctata]|uniref:C2H2-type domain-containing protein n=1 Tax=Diploptera punctata TaxID=6984 RepID=A0AAD7ZXQ2_DIPPU|nr:hypothetical protein L9F63_018495 [Diploptera punctata]